MKGAAHYLTVYEPAFMRKSGVSRDIRWNSLEHFCLTA